jgi:hypothetical protein
LKGVVPGTFIFKRADLVTTSQVNTSDTTGNGALFRTQLVFKPDRPLKAVTQYTMYLVGDDDNTDEELYGLRSRSVFDPVADPGNTGTGSVTFSGSYTGHLTTDSLSVRVTTAGGIGVAQFEAWFDSAPLDLIGPFPASTSETLLGNGVTVQFVSGEFQVDDLFTVVLKKPEIFTDTVVASFVTGNGSITSVPTTTATSLTGDPVPLDTSNVFKLVRSTPSDGDSNLNPSLAKRIVLEFNQEVDPTTVNTSSVSILSEPVTDHPLLENSVPTGPITHTVTVSGMNIIIDL